MALTITDVDICNQALDMLKEAPIASMDEESATAERLNRNFNVWRTTFLSLHPWNFATKRASIAEDGTTPAFGWKHRYTIPDDCLQIRPLRYDGAFNKPLISYEVEDGYILTDQTTPLKIIYTYDHTAYGGWHYAAVTAFAAYIAYNVAHAITGKVSAKEIMRQAWEDAMSEAKRLDGMQGTLEVADTNDVIAVRY